MVFRGYRFVDFYQRNTDPLAGTVRGGYRGGIAGPPARTVRRGYKKGEPPNPPCRNGQLGVQRGHITDF